MEQVIVAARNGGLPKRYASCPAAGKDLERMANSVLWFAVVPNLQTLIAGGQFGLAASAAVKQAPASVAIVVQATFAPALGSVNSIVGSTLQPSSNIVGPLDDTVAGHERITIGKPALARWRGEGSSSLAQYKVLAPLLAAGATERQFDTGSSQRRFA